MSRYTGPPASTSVFVDIWVAPANVSAFLQAIKPLNDFVLAEPENRDYTTYQSVETPGYFKLVENWNAPVDWLMSLILGSETASTLSSRGVHLFPVTNYSSAPVNDTSGGNSTLQQVSAYELYSAPFGSSPDKVFAEQDRNPYVGGEFVWTGFDYIGEPTPYYSAWSSYSGIVDLAGFKKDRSWLYQTRWRPDERIAHILPHWTWPERVGELTPVHVFSEADEAEPFLNGSSNKR
ncbi:hypothetical protein LCI18_013894 [Fusarium solani-melongenae]|uniref:Uncharacterized protein n=1 Tax=Fusarium solani subsp. cucurbitae TaxID=2747967 RepID=A0ACD3ZNQ8_FUSSC|nr:hypothetical protein LCI18_013894 [Fusarium solani-melongenae]